MEYTLNAIDDCDYHLYLLIRKPAILFMPFFIIIFSITQNWLELIPLKLMTILELYY